MQSRKSASNVIFEQYRHRLGKKKNYGNALKNQRERLLGVDLWSKPLGKEDSYFKHHGGDARWDLKECISNQNPTICVASN